MGLLASGVALLASGMGLLTSGVGLLTSGVGLLTSGVGLLTSGVLSRALVCVCSVCSLAFLDLKLYFLCIFVISTHIIYILHTCVAGGGDRVLTFGHKRGWVVSTTFSKTLSTQVLTVVVLRVFPAKQLALCTN